MADPIRTATRKVLWRIEDGVGHIILNRPEAANALDSESGEAFAEAIDQAARADIGAVLISSTGKHFCAGGDINEFVEHRAELDRLVQRLLDRLHPAIHSLATLSVPVLSAVQGPLGGAGISVALCADIVLAAPAMKLRGGYSAIGLSPDLGASYYLAQRAGAVRAKNILLTNRPISAEQCLAWGIVDELHSAEALPEAALALATRLARGATASLGAIKRLCNSACAHDLRTHLSLEREALLRCAVSADGGEGVTAFVEKRAARFTDERRP
jgi:2-(1,2-epoxy-1,2-dihydrophenyl)acetyl-CoA isomerase